MNLSSLTQKKWGLPIWAWAVIAAVILFGLYIMMKRRSSTSSANATPAASQNTTGDIPNPLDGSGSGGGLGVPDTSQPDPTTVVGSSTPGPNNNPDPVTTTVPTTPTPTQTTTPSTSPTKPDATPSSSTLTSAVLVPANATATTLQAGVAKTGPSAITVPGTPLRAAQLNHPSAVKITANKTGGSANKAQGVFAIH